MWKFDRPASLSITIIIYVWGVGVVDVKIKSCKTVWWLCLVICCSTIVIDISLDMLKIIPAQTLEKDNEQNLKQNVP